MSIFSNDILSSHFNMIEVIFGSHFITIITILAIYATRNENIALGAKKIWTEQDEARRIEQVVWYIYH